MIIMKLFSSESLLLLMVSSAGLIKSTAAQVSTQCRTETGTINAALPDNDVTQGDDIDCDNGFPNVQCSANDSRFADDFAMLCENIGGKHVIANFFIDCSSVSETDGIDEVREDYDNYNYCAGKSCSSGDLNQLLQIIAQDFSDFDEGRFEEVLGVPFECIGIVESVDDASSGTTANNVDGGGLSAGAIVGIVVGVVTVLAAATITWWGVRSHCGSFGSSDKNDEHISSEIAVEDTFSPSQQSNGRVISITNPPAVRQPTAAVVATRVEPDLQPQINAKNTLGTFVGDHSADPRRGGGTTSTGAANHPSAGRLVASAADNQMGVENSPLVEAIAVDCSRIDP